MCRYSYTNRQAPVKNIGQVPKLKCIKFGCTFSKKGTVVLPDVALPCTTQAERHVFLWSTCHP